MVWYLWIVLHKINTEGIEPHLAAVSRNKEYKTE
jgi:hypothetical protein